MQTRARVKDGLDVNGRMRHMGMDGALAVLLLLV